MTQIAAIQGLPKLKLELELYKTSEPNYHCGTCGDEIG